MFYCEDCRKQMAWPEGLSRSRGPCEICKRDKPCYCVDSKWLPVEVDALTGNAVEEDKNGD